MDMFLETYNFPRVNYDETENLNRPIMSKKTKSRIKIFPAKSIPDQTASFMNSSKTYMHSHIYYSIIHNSQDMEIIYLSVDGWIM